MKIIDKCLWYGKRLSKMPPEETFHRLCHKFHASLDKKKITQSLMVPHCDLSIDYVGEIARRCCAINEDIASEISTSHLLELDIFNINCGRIETVNWHKDPKTEKLWPLEFWTKINIRDGFAIGGPKFVWEANRFYFMPQLGLSFYKTRDRKYADKIFELLADWVQKNPYGYGVNWTSGIELSVRLANLIWALFYLQDYELDDEKEKILREFLFYHGRHLYRYQSKYSSNNNHAIAEAFGLFLLGVYFPSFPQSQKWKNFGQKVLEREGLRQIVGDGGSYECSTTYLSFVFDFFLLFKLVCEQNNIQYDERLNDRLEKSCDFIATLLDENGNIPNIGDQDSAVLVNFGLDNLENFESILNTGAVEFNRPDLCRDNFPDVKTLLLLGEERVNAFRERHDVVQAGEEGATLLCRKFAESGLAVLKDVVAGRQIVFTGNATPLGMPPLYAHGHLDALSFCLNAGGLEIFVDPGTYLYHSGGKWRKYFRSTAAHNTIRIDGQDFTDMPGDFMFGKPYLVSNHVLDELEENVVWSAEHDAYTRLSNPVVHKRNVAWNKKNKAFTILDKLQTSSEHMVEMFFHFHPDCNVEIEANRVFVKREDVVFELEFDKALEIKLFNGSEKPLLGWYSKSFNHIAKSNTLICSKTIRQTESIGTKIRCCWS